MASIEIPADINASNVRQYLADVVWEKFETERTHLDRISEWATGCQPEYLVPARTSHEKRALLKLGKTPWLGLVVESFTQALAIQAYRTQGSTDNVPGPWQTWNANGFRARQTSIHRAALMYGHAYARALPGAALDGKAQAQLRGLSPRRVLALYDDPVADDFPRYAMEWLQDAHTVRFYTDEVYFDIPMPTRGTFPQDKAIAVTEHGAGVVPIVRYLNTMDLDGRVRGEVEHLIPVASRLDKTLFDRLLAQHFASWRVRWATGLDNAADDDDPAAFLAELSQSDTLVTASADAKFGTLDPTPLADFITAYERDLSDLEDAAQLPPNWSGGVSNVGPEALSLLRANTKNKLTERQITFGSAHNQLLRLSAKIEGDMDAASDFHASVIWEDVDLRSLGAAVDAYSKLHLMLGVPAKSLWSKFGSEDDVAEWVAEFKSTDSTSEELRYWGLGQPVPGGAGSNAPQPNAEPGQTA